MFWPIKSNYLIIPLIAVFVAISGSSITTLGLEWYYSSLQLPAWTPDGSLIGMIWTLIYFLTSISALLFYNHEPRGAQFQKVIVLFVANAILNVGWSFVFFGLHAIFVSFLVCLFLEGSVLVLMYYLWKRDRYSALLLVPYAVWVAFATYLNFFIWKLN